MTEAAVLSKSGRKKRGQGRPVSGENDVGRDRLLIATEKLLRIMPPARVTISRIAQEANVDPLFLYVAVLGASDFFSSAGALIRDLLPPNTDMEKLTAGFQEFMVKLVLDGLRKR